MRANLRGGAMFQHACSCRVEVLSLFPHAQHSLKCGTRLRRHRSEGCWSKAQGEAKLSTSNGQRRFAVDTPHTFTCHILHLHVHPHLHVHSHSHLHVHLRSSHHESNALNESIGVVYNYILSGISRSAESAALGDPELLVARLPSSVFCCCHDVRTTTYAPAERRPTTSAPATAMPTMRGTLRSSDEGGGEGGGE